MNNDKSHTIKNSSFRKTRRRSKQLQVLLQRIEITGLENGRKYTIDRSVPFSEVQPELLPHYLRQAVKANDNIVVDDFLNYYPDLITPEGCKESTLWIAVKNCNVAITRSLIFSGANLSEKLLSHPNKPSFLHYVITSWQEHKDIEIATFMIEHGAEVNACDANGNSVLHISIIYGVDYSLVEKLLENGADIDAVNRDGYDMLTAVCAGKSEKLLPLLVGYGVDEDTKKRRAMIALRYLIVNEDRKLEAVRRLLEMNLPINDLDDRGLTLLHWAVSVDWTEAVKILLDLGAEINLRSTGGTIPLFEAAKLPTSCITRLLIKNRAHIQLGHDDGRHLIHAACGEGSHENIHLLLQLGADLNAIDKLGHTPFFYLHLNNANRLCIALILEKLALLQTKGLKIHEVNLSIIEHNCSVKNYYEDCLKQLWKMKEIKVYNNIPFYCFFSKSVIELSKLLRNNNFVENYKTRDGSLFPLYRMQMKYAFAIAKQAKIILARNENMLSALFHSVLSDVVVKKIVGYACNDELKNLPREFYFTLHEKINKGEPGYIKDMLQ